MKKKLPLCITKRNHFGEKHICGMDMSSDNFPSIFKKLSKSKKRKKMRNKATIASILKIKMLHSPKGHLSVQPNIRFTREVKLRQESLLLTKLILKISIGMRKTMFLQLVSEWGHRKKIIGICELTII